MRFALAFAWIAGALMCAPLVGLLVGRRWTPPPAAHTITCHGIGAAVDYQDGSTLVATVDEAYVTVTCAGYEIGTSWAVAIDGAHASGPCPNCGDTLTTEVS